MRIGLLTPTTRLGLATAALLALGGCTLVSDLDRFESEESGGNNGNGGAGDAGADTGAGNGGEPDIGCSNPRTLCVRLKDFSPHVDELVVIDLVAQDGSLRARAMLDPMSFDGNTRADVVMPLAIPKSEVPDEGDKHELHLEIWGDKTGDREYTPNENGETRDHDWIVDLPENGNVVFEHNTVFRDLLPRPSSIGGDFNMRLRDFGLHDGQMLEVMVIEDNTDRTVGLYRLQEVPDDGEVEIEIPGIIDPDGIVYRVEFYADFNDNRTYDDPPDDHTWISFVESNDDGIDFTFRHGGMFEALNHQFDFEK
jgi:hypothetical protein